MSGPDAGGDVRVKPLEWVEDDDNGRAVWRARTDLGQVYTISDDGFSTPPYRLCLHQLHLGSFNIIGVAKSAAQNDYERRIRSALAQPDASNASAEITMADIRARVGDGMVSSDDVIAAANTLIKTHIASAEARMRDETGWLIEKDDPPVYSIVNPNDYDEHWTTDAGTALRFARREDAQAYSDHIGWTSPPVRIVEHMWPALSPADGDEATKSEGGTEAEFPAWTDEDKAYELGRRDGYESAIQDLDLATGGDGEFKGSTIPGETVDVPAMKQRIIRRICDAHPPDPTAAPAAVDVEAIARIIAPDTFAKFDTELANGRRAENGRCWAELCYSEVLNAAREKATAILSLLNASDAERVR